MRNYIGLIHKRRGSDFGVSFPDFPGVITAGTRLSTTRERWPRKRSPFMSKVSMEDGEIIPEPMTLEEIMSDPDNRSGVAILVSLKTEQAKAVRVNVTPPADVLEQIRQIRRSARLHAIRVASRRPPRS